MSRSLPLVLLRAEGLVLVVASVTAFWSLEGGWGWFALLLLAPDLCFVAYLAGARAGTVVYNLARQGLGDGTQFGGVDRGTHRSRHG